MLDKIVQRPSNHEWSKQIIKKYILHLYSFFPQSVIVVCVICILSDMKQLKQLFFTISGFFCLLVFVLDLGGFFFIKNTPIQTGRKMTKWLRKDGLFRCMELYRSNDPLKETIQLLSTNNQLPVATRNDMQRTDLVEWIKATNKEITRIKCNEHWKPIRCFFTCTLT